MLKDLKKIMTKELRGSMRLPQQIENINRKTEIIKKIYKLCRSKVQYSTEWLAQQQF